MGGEQALIERYFWHLGAVRTDVVLGIGDDAALLRPAPGMDLVQTTDSLVENVHFLAGAAPRSLGFRALAVNLSDLAAMGATPSWALLSLTLPRVDEDWLAEFAAGFGLLAREHEVALVGGNISRGPLNATLLLSGQVPMGTGLRRSGGQSGDEVWVSGTLGDAAAGRRAGADPQLQDRFEYPTARVALGAALRTVASACIDVSDGLIADLPRLAAASGCGVSLDAEALPVSAPLRALEGAQAWRAALQGGEDYELCFTVPPERAAAVAGIGRSLGVALQCCGRLRAQAGLEVRLGADVIQFSQSGFDHFPS